MTESGVAESSEKRQQKKRRHTIRRYQMEENSANTNLIVKTTSLTMHIVSDYIRPGDTVVDCTMGNGYDTLSLAAAAGCGKDSTIRGRVYAFDIQQQAVDATRAYLQENGIENPEENGIYLIRASHEQMDLHLPDPSKTEISAFVFNLGFMPGKDKTVMTKAATSLPAIKKAINMVKQNGIVSVMAYTGHKEGEEEHAVITEFLKTLPSKKYHVAYVNMINQKKTAPSLFLITPKVRERGIL